MEVLFHLIFEIVKVIILAFIYSKILLFIFQKIKKSNPKSWFQRVAVNKKRFLFVSRLMIFILLFGWLFTHWGDHSLGDSARIPLGNDRAVEQMNGNLSYISPEGFENQMFLIDTFSTNKNYCVGTTNKKGEKYFIWNLKTNNLASLNSKEQFENKVKDLGLPSINQFKKFADGYHKYWGGWRFFLLP